MSTKAGNAVQRWLSILLLTTMVLSGVLAFLGSHGARGTITVSNGNWIVTGSNEYTDAEFTIDGNLYVNGTLILHNSKITFNQDTGHRYRIVISSGNELRLDKSLITVATTSAAPYLTFAVDVNGTLNAWSGSTLKFPGYINAWGSGRINITNSLVTGFTSQEVSAYSTSASFIDSNDDGPAIIVRDTSEMYVVKSRIEKLFEHTSVNDGLRRNITLRNSARMWLIDSFVAVDFKNSTNDHNIFSLEGSSQLNIYNVTVDPQGIAADKKSAIVAVSTARAHIFRWASVKATDAYGVAINGARVRTFQMPQVTTATYPDNGGATVPHALVRWYLGKTSANFNITGSDGKALIPLLTDTIDATFVGSVSSSFTGNYRANTTYVKTSTFYGDLDYTFAAYPSLDQATNTKEVTVALKTLINPRTPGATWSTDADVNFDVTVSTDVLITGRITIRDATLNLTQAGESYIQIQSGGSLTLVNATATSNHRLVIHVSAGWFNATQGSRVLLAGDLGEGVVASTGTGVITLRDTILVGSVSGAGGTTSLRNVTMTGSSVDVTRGRANLYDVVFVQETNLRLTTDDNSLATIDVDLRNLTLSQSMMGQLTFSGRQWVQLTNVSPLPSGNWWTSMVSGEAKVSRHAWLNMRVVDGTGTPLPGASVDILRLNPLTLTFSRVSTPAVDDLYGAVSLAVPATTTTAPLIYRASVEEASVAYHFMNNSYRLDASKVVGGQTFYPDGNPINVPSMDGDTTVSLVFSSLTPDFRITSIVFWGANGDFDFQPTGQRVYISAFVRNDGSVDTTNVQVNFYNFNIDANDDGLLDGLASDYQPFRFHQATLNIPASTTINVTTSYVVPRTANTAITISVMVDPFNNITELRENNNILKRIIQPFHAPDLRVRSEDITIDRTPVAGGTVFVNVTVANIGTAGATAAYLTLSNWTGSSWNVLVTSSTFSVSSGGTTRVMVQWTPQNPGSHDLRVIVYTANNSGFPDTNRDYNWTNNVAFRSGIQVATKPDLELRASDYSSLNFVKGRTYTINVTIYNLGASPAQDVTLTAYINAVTTSNITGTATGIVVPGSGSTTVQLTINAIQTTGTFNLILVVDPSNVIPETNEGNNQVTIPLQVVPPSGVIQLSQPDPSAVFTPGESIVVEGFVLTLSGVPISGQNITVVLRDEENSPVFSRTVRTDNQGRFLVGMTIPEAADDGSWRITATANVADITDASVSVSVQRSVEIWNRTIPLLNLPVWMFLVILALVIGAVIGLTTYMKYIGVGHLVECGECGAFIPESSSVCPKCGVEFERSMAKCSNCHAWIPANVKNCPECGIEFTTGEVKMTEYQEKMRTQYDTLVQRYRDEANRQMGRQLSDKEFQDWWRRQPSFVTFNDWMRQEEDMRKMGSRPCPKCGQPNAVTATVCHKCGSPMQTTPPPQQPRTPPPGVVMGQVVQRPPQPPPPPPQGGQQAQGGSLFKRLTGGAVVQKKVVKKTGETQEEKKDDVL